MPLAPYIKVRSDSFRIRTYGESKNADGQVMSRAYCEAIVQRGIHFVSPTDSPDTALNALNTENKKYGRRFQVTSFKWLSPQEI